MSRPERQTTQISNIPLLNPMAVDASGDPIEPETQYNKTLTVLDTLIGRQVTNRTTTAPPGSPSDGDMYIVAATATGAWASHEGELAIWLADSSEWYFVPVKTGFIIYDEGNNDYYYWSPNSGGSWQRFIYEDFGGVTPTTIPTFTGSVSNPPQDAEVEALRVAVNNLITALKAVDVIQ